MSIRLKLVSMNVSRGASPRFSHVRIIGCLTKKAEKVVLKQRALHVTRPWGSPHRCLRYAALCASSAANEFQL